MNRWTASLSQTCLLVALAVTLPACDRFGAYCEEKMSCEDGNEMDTEACIVQAEEGEELASLWECDEWFDALVECVEAESSCENDHYIVEGDDCESEQEDFAACM